MAAIEEGDKVRTIYDCQVHFFHEGCPRLGDKVVDRGVVGAAHRVFQILGTKSTPLSADFKSHMPGDCSGGVVTPLARSVGRSLSGSAAAVAKSRMKSRKRVGHLLAGSSPGCAPRIPLISSRSLSGKGCCFSPHWVDQMVCGTIRRTSAMICLPRLPKQEMGLRGGGNHPGDGLPPPSRNGRDLNKARWSIMISSIK